MTTVAFTLPISCHICLGKVKEPVCCDNNHVYCRACIQIWTSKNKHCPACRTDINADHPFRELLGGQNLDKEESHSFSQPMVRKARVKSLFNAYEDEIQSLNDEISSLKEQNKQLRTNLPITTSPQTMTCNDSLNERDKESLNLLSTKLSEATQLYNKVNKDLHKYQQENGELQEANVDLTRENERLRYDLNQKTPNKVARFTVAALESQIDKQKREINNLEKALSVSDRHITKLEEELNKYQHNKPLPQTKNSELEVPNPSTNPIQHQNSSVPKAFSLKSATRTLFSRPSSAPICGTSIGGASNCSSIPYSTTSTKGSVRTNKSNEKKWGSSPVSQLLISAPTNTNKVLTTPTKRRVSADSTLHLEEPSPTTSSLYKLRELRLIPGSPNKRSRAIEFEAGDFSAGELTYESRQSGVDTATDEESGATFSSFARDESLDSAVYDQIAAQDISMTSDFTDCLRILQNAERNVKDKQTTSK